MRVAGPPLPYIVLDFPILRSQRTAKMLNHPGARSGPWQ